MAQDQLTILRPNQNVLRVTPKEDRFDLSVSGGGNVTQAEYTQIADYVADQTGAEPFLAKLRARMER